MWGRDGWRGRPTAQVRLHKKLDDLFTAISPRTASGIELSLTNVTYRKWDRQWHEMCCPACVTLLGRNYTVHDDVHDCVVRQGFKHTVTSNEAYSIHVYKNLWTVNKAKYKYTINCLNIITSYSLVISSSVAVIALYELDLNLRILSTFIPVCHQKIIFIKLSPI